MAKWPSELLESGDWEDGDSGIQIHLKSHDGASGTEEFEPGCVS